MRKHEKFILTPIETLLEDCITACYLSMEGMEAYPLSEYIMQSVFLRMTGFNEQKLKCVIWELATNDYDIRYRVFSRNAIGECSSLGDKNKVLNELINSIRSVRECSFENDRKRLISETYTCCLNLVDRSSFKIWLPRDYGAFLELPSRIDEKAILVKNKRNGYTLFKNDDGIERGYSLYRAFEGAYRHRNRCAHNLLSYQENLPGFEKLSDYEYCYYENWFVRYYMLILIDKIFVFLYEIYQNCCLNL